MVNDTPLLQRMLDSHIFDGFTPLFLLPLEQRPYHITGTLILGRSIADLSADEKAWLVDKLNKRLQEMIYPEKEN